MEQKIDCDVKNCIHCNCKSCCCELKEIKVSNSNTNKACTKKETMCSNFKEKS